MSSDKIVPPQNVKLPLILGKTWLENSEESYYSIRYDFKPASVDVHKEGRIDINDQEVTVSMPMVGQNNSATYNGNHTPCLKDAVLIYDTETGTVTLERIRSAIRVKKSRHDDKRSRPAPYSVENGAKKSSISNEIKSQKSPASHAIKSPTGHTNNVESYDRNRNSMPLLGLDDAQKAQGNHSIMSDHSSSDSGSGSSCSSDSDSDSGSESESDVKSNTTGHIPVNNNAPHNVMDDLNLSEED